MQRSCGDRDAKNKPGRSLWLWGSSLCLAALVVTAAAPRDPFTLDRAGERWVEQTLKTLTPEAKIGQLIVPSFESNFLSTDSDTFEMLTRLVRDYHVGGFHVFGASQPAPSVLLNAGYGTVILGQPFSAAFLINRLQAQSSVPLLNTADFETGVGFRIFGATAFPRQMAMGAIPGADGLRLVREEARITAVESRALGVQVNFAPVADVNNNARNPVINIRSYGENPERVGALVGAYVAGARDGRMIATLKHFPGHGDTDVDSHLGLPVISYDRARLDAIELPPFRRGGRGRAAAVPPWRRAGGSGGDGSAHRLAGARSLARDTRDVQPADPARSAAHRARVRRPRLHRFDVDGRGGQDGAT